MNHKFFQYIGIITCLCSMVVFSSCLKDRNGETNLTDVPQPGEVAEISDPGFHALAFNFTTVPQMIPAYINIASPHPVGQDVVVTLELYPTGLADYNTANGTAFELPASNAYSIPNFKVTIKKGKNLDSLPIIIYPDKVDLSKQLAIPIRIVDASGRVISENFKMAIYAIGVKNKYEGQYHSVGYFQHPSSPRAINRDKYLSTLSANTVETELGDLGTWHMQLTINADNSISFVPSGAANPTAALIGGDPVYNNTYNPATQTFKLKYGYPNPGPTRIITETISPK